MAKIVSINVSNKKGCRKYPIKEAFLKYGIEGDAHSGKGERQLSLLSTSSIEKMRKKGYNIQYGELAENITIDGIKASDIKIGLKMAIGKAIIEVTKIGKDCNKECELFKGKVEDCMMAKEGFFAKVIKEGEIKIGSNIKIL